MSQFPTGLKEAIDKIESLVKQATPLRFEAPYSDRPHVKFAIKQDGSWQELMRADPLHNERLATPQELAAFIENVSRDDNPDLPAAGKVMVSDGAVVYTYDFESRINFATVALLKSKPYQWLLSNDDAGNSQPELDKALRVTLRGTHSGELHDAIKALKFTQTNEATGNIANQENSFSRAVQNKVTGATAIPQDVSFNLSLYDNFVHPVVIDAAVSVDIENETIILSIYPQSLLNAQQETADAIKSLYKVPAFAGSF